MFELLSVSCLSIAAKMEEVDVPLLRDLQVSEKAAAAIDKHVIGPH